MIAYSLYVLILSIGVYLNGAICLTYHAASDHDIKYVIFYAKIIVIYGISLILYCISLFKQKNYHQIIKMKETIQNELKEKY